MPLCVLYISNDSRGDFQGVVLWLPEEESTSPEDGDDDSSQRRDPMERAILIEAARHAGARDCVPHEPVSTGISYGRMGIVGA